MTLNAVRVLLVHDTVWLAVAIRAWGDGLVLVHMALGTGQVVVRLLRFVQGGDNIIMATGTEGGR